MSIKNKVLAVAATMTMAGGVSAVGLLAAPKGTAWSTAPPSYGTSSARGKR